MISVLPHAGEIPYGRGKHGLVGSRDNLRGNCAIVGNIHKVVGTLQNMLIKLCSLNSF